jgi:hypothetical protein
VPPGTAPSWAIAGATKQAAMMAVVILRNFIEVNGAKNERQGKKKEIERKSSTRMKTGELYLYDSNSARARFAWENDTFMEDWYLLLPGVPIFNLIQSFSQRVSYVFIHRSLR